MNKKKARRRRARKQRRRPQPRPRENNLTPGGKTHRRKRLRRLKVDTLPLVAQRFIARGLTEGDSFKKISTGLRALGHPVGYHALSSFWHTVWRDEHDRLRRARFLFEVIKAALHLDPESESAKAAEETLYTLIWGRLDDLEIREPLRLAREAREHKKLRVKKEDIITPDSKILTEEEVDRRIREVYQLPFNNGSAHRDSD